CPLRGSLHGHHPRDCLFYLRDWEPPRLQRLLRVRGAGAGGQLWGSYGAGGRRLCCYGGPFWVGSLGGTWGSPRVVVGGRADLPAGRGHYTEYLVRLINEHRLDPARLYTPAELHAAAERHLP
ncbi:UNVERIFIED_CONTAM: E3 ubiquitin-protein ligase RNF31, partial [Eudyptes pachyrhynchus]